MTDDPRLEAVATAHTLVPVALIDMQYDHRGVAAQFCAMMRAFLGEDAERKEVIDHTKPAVAGHRPDNASAPVAAGADPPWLEEAVTEACHAFHKTYTTQSSQWRAIARAVLRVANAQPVSDVEVEAAIEAHDPVAWEGHQHWAAIGNRTSLSEALLRFRRALEAAAKVRAGG